MPTPHPRRFLSFVLLTLVVAGRAQADWTFNGVPICTATANQDAPFITGDGAGGAYIGWSDGRGAGGGPDIYLQRITGSGALAAGSWMTNGIVVSGASGSQTFPCGAFTGGGVVVAWADGRPGNQQNDIYGAGIGPSGSLLPGAWLANGIPLAQAAGAQSAPNAIADGSGGAYLTWSDARDTTGIDVYVIRIQSDGSVAPGWPPNGLAVCTATGSQNGAKLALDGADGVFLVWVDSRSGAEAVYAQHVLSTGAVAGGWPGNGLLVSATGGPGPYAIANDLSGGVFLVWTDVRNELTKGLDLYAQHLTGSGVLAPGAWAASGIALSSQSNNQLAPIALPDGAGGVLVAWEDERASPGSGDIYAARVTGAGATAFGWAAGGTPLCTAAGDQRFQPAFQGRPIAGDGAGGIFAAWTDPRDQAASGADLYATHLDGTGALFFGWTDQGSPVAVGIGDQKSPVMVEDGSQGAFVAWIDSRNGIDTDIYASRLVPIGVVSVDERVSAPRARFSSPRPNPAGGEQVLRFELPARAVVHLAVFDRSGRKVRELESREMEPGAHEVSWRGTDDAGARLASGVYFASLEAVVEGRRERVTTKIVLLGPDRR